MMVHGVAKWNQRHYASMCSLSKWVLVCLCYCAVNQGGMIEEMVGHGTTDQLSAITSSKYFVKGTDQFLMYCAYLSVRTSIFTMFYNCLLKYFVSGVMSLPFLWLYCKWYPQEQKLTVIEMIMYCIFYQIVPPCTPLPGFGTLGPNTMKAWSLGGLAVPEPSVGWPFRNVPWVFYPLRTWCVRIAEPSGAPTTCQIVLQYLRVAVFWGGCFFLPFMNTLLDTKTYQAMSAKGEGSLAFLFTIPYKILVFFTCSGLLVAYVQGGMQHEWTSVQLSTEYDEVGGAELLPFSESSHQPQV